LLNIHVGVAQCLKIDIDVWSSDDEVEVRDCYMGRQKNQEFKVERRENGIRRSLRRNPTLPRVEEEDSASDELVQVAMWERPVADIDTNTDSTPTVRT